MIAGWLAGLGLLLPLAGYLVNRHGGRRRRDLTRVAGPGAIGLSFLFFVAAAISNGAGASDHLFYHWILAAASQGSGAPVPGVDFDLYLDPLAAVMTLVVTGVGFVIHAYSVGYMDDENDEDYSRFFAHMNLFVFSMLLLVLAHNFVILVIGWALVGLCSYLLIGFWTERQGAVDAARKAFVMNVIGDVGIVIASFVVLDAAGSLSFDALFARAPLCAGPGGAHCVAASAIGGGTLELIAFFLLVGAVAKSAQIPLHTWLPDAMEGPTPVSALIHAATMVTAGVYLIARFAPLYAHAPAAAATAQYLGLATALMAALVATVQTDIKRVLAYSTMSQVGYMVFAVSIGAEVAGIFHLVTHAFFKALLFLTAGNVIHALGGEQDLRKMGGLWREMPLTGFLFLIGALALAGMVPLAGFFSKDEIISAGITMGPGHPLGGLLLAVGAGLTGYYAMRAFYLAFVGRRTEGQGDTHEPGRVMTVPVVILASLAAVGGLIQPGPWHLLADYTRRVFGELSVLIDPGAVVLTLGLVLAGLVAAYQHFGTGRPEERAPAVLARAFYWDDLYRAVVLTPLWAAGSGLYRAAELPLVIGVADAGAALAAIAGRQVRRLQSGYLRSYALLFAGAALVAVVLVGVNLR